jgi:solute carrier family 25 protein 44
MSKITQQQQKYELSHEEANAIKLNKSQNISDIQWFMIDKKKYFPMTVLNMFAVRTVLYPLTLVRTRLQIQPVNKKIYTGTIHALYSVVKYEGYLALYKGFLINNLALIPHVLYITTYEV